LCGDHINIYLKMDNDRIEDISFQGTGCAISKASASLMTDALKGKSRAEASALFEKFHDMVTGDLSSTPAIESIGKLAVFSGVREYPARVKCATLAWHTLQAALKGTDTVTTE
ncbi:MAG: SUF system NifU family Fe-S cluster assembly protein, partial [bacterium]|nr:SUF system NifU family Fe-S cluster assembly protein [bacterium]